MALEQLGYRGVVCSTADKETSKAAKLVDEIRRLNVLNEKQVFLPDWNEASLILVDANVNVDKLVLPTGYRLEPLQPHQSKNGPKDSWMLTNESKENRQTTGWYTFEMRRA